MWCLIARPEGVYEVMSDTTANILGKVEGALVGLFEDKAFAISAAICFIAIEKHCIEVTDKALVTKYLVVESGGLSNDKAL